MTDFDRIRNLIIKYETQPSKLTKEKLLDKICEVCFGRKLGEKYNNDKTCL